MAEWKAPQLCEHRRPRKLVMSQSPAVGVCVSQWCQGLTHVEKKPESTPVEECKGSDPLQDLLGQTVQSCLFCDLRGQTTQAFSALSMPCNQVRNADKDPRRTYSLSGF